MECKCTDCKSQCTKTPCLGTPGDIMRLIDAGYDHRLAETVWRAGVKMGIIDRDVIMIQPSFDNAKGSCTFFTNGLCELHDLGLKPTEGRLSYHTIRETNTNPKKNLAWHVVKEWLNPGPETIEAFERFENKQTG